MTSKRREINIEVHLFILIALTGYMVHDTMNLRYYTIIMYRPIYGGAVFVG